MSELLRSKMSQLSEVGVSKQICELLTQYIETAPPEKLYHISPFRVADEWSLDRYEVLDAFLYGWRGCSRLWRKCCW